MDKIKKVVTPKATPNSKTVKQRLPEQNKPSSSKSNTEAKPSRPTTTKTLKSSSPWDFTPKAGSDIPLSLPSACTRNLCDLFLESDSEAIPDWQVADDLLINASQCSQLFTKRLLQQKLAEPMELLTPKPAVQELKQMFHNLSQFLVENPNFFLDLFGDSGYLCFPGLIRSEVFSLLAAILTQKELEVLKFAAYPPDEIHQIVLQLRKKLEWIDSLSPELLLVEKSLI